MITGHLGAIAVGGRQVGRARTIIETDLVAAATPEVVVVRGSAT